MTYVLIVAIPVVALLAAFLLWRMRRSTLPLLIGTALLGVAYAVANVLIATGYEDADGFMDCWPSCSGVQEAVNVTFWFGGAALALITIACLAWSAVIVATRERRDAGSV